MWGWLRRRGAVDSCAAGAEIPTENRPERLKAEEALVEDVVRELAKTKADYRLSNATLARFYGCDEWWIEDFFRGYVRVGRHRRSPTLREVARLAHVMDQRVRVSLEYLPGGYV